MQSEGSPHFWATTAPRSTRSTTTILAPTITRLTHLTSSLFLSLFYSSRCNFLFFFFIVRLSSGFLFCFFNLDLSGYSLQ